MRLSLFILDADLDTITFNYIFCIPKGIPIKEKNPSRLCRIIITVGVFYTCLRVLLGIGDRLILAFEISHVHSTMSTYITLQVCLVDTHKK